MSFENKQVNGLFLIGNRFNKHATAILCGLIFSLLSNGFSTLHAVDSNGGTATVSEKQARETPPLDKGIASALRSADEAALTSLLRPDESTFYAISKDGTLNELGEGFDTLSDDELKEIYQEIKNVDEFVRKLRKNMSHWGENPIFLGTFIDESQRFNKDFSIGRLVFIWLNNQNNVPSLIQIKFDDCMWKTANGALQSIWAFDIDISRVPSEDAIDQDLIAETALFQKTDQAKILNDWWREQSKTLGHIRVIANILINL